MSEDKELLKKCWDEYTDQFDLFGDEWQDLGYDEIFKAGFEAAKRSQPIVVLPKPDTVEISFNYGDFVTSRNVYDSDEVHASLTAAGIKYTIGE